MAAGRGRSGLLVGAVSGVAAPSTPRPTRCRLRPSISSSPPRSSGWWDWQSARGAGAGADGGGARGRPSWPRASSSQRPTSGSSPRGASTINGRRSTSASASIGGGRRRSGCPPSPSTPSTNGCSRRISARTAVADHAGPGRDAAAGLPRATLRLRLGVRPDVVPGMPKWSVLQPYLRWAGMMASPTRSCRRSSSTTICCRWNGRSRLARVGTPGRSRPRSRGELRRLAHLSGRHRPDAVQRRPVGVRARLRGEPRANRESCC